MAAKIPFQNIRWQIKEIFHNIYEAEFKEKLRPQAFTFFYSLIDDVVARVNESRRWIYLGAVRTMTGML